MAPSEESLALGGVQLGPSSASLERPLRASSPPCYSHPVTFHYEIHSHSSRLQRLAKALGPHRLAASTLACMGAGLALGLLLRPHAGSWTERQFMYVELVGKLYLRLVKLLLLPLLVSNVILAFGTIQARLSRRLAKVAGLLYLASNLLALVVAIGLVLALHPGSAPAHHQHHRHHQPPPHSPPPPPSSPLHQQPHHQQAPSTRDLRPHPRTDMNYFNQNLRSDTRHAETNHKPQAINLASRSLQNFLLESNRIKDHHQRLVAAAHLTQNGPHQQIISAQGENMSQAIDKLDQRLIKSTKLPVDVLLDVLFNLVPDSLIGAALQQTRIRLNAPRDLVINSNGTTQPPPSRWPLSHETLGQANILGLLALSVLTGVALGRMQEAGKPMLDLCSCVAELSLRLGVWSANLMPVSVMFLLVGQLARSHDLSALVSSTSDLLMYSATVLAALVVHSCLLLPLVYYLITRKSPLAFLVAMLEALVAAFATSSSAASMALMLNCLSKLKLNHVIVGAFGPLGSVFNMNGTAIYEAIGAIFIAQTLGANLPMTSLLLVGLVASLASFSTCGVPSSGLVSMVIVLNTINLPVLQLGLLYIIDFAIDRFRTVVNVWSGAIVCALINQLCSRDLFKEELKRKKCRESMRSNYDSTRLNSNGGSANSLANLACEPAAASTIEVAAKPKVISITITPPLENSHV